MSSLLEALQARQARHGELRAILDAERAQRKLLLDRRAIQRAVADRLTDWRKLLTNEHVRGGREFLRSALVGPVRFTPDGRAYKFEGHTALGRVFEGLIPFQPIWRPQRDSNPRYRRERPAS
jgi:hypothetical protein